MLRRLAFSALAGVLCGACKPDANSDPGDDRGPAKPSPRSDPSPQPPAHDTPARTAEAPDLSPPPTIVPTRSTLAVGSSHSCAVVRVGTETTGRVKCWGDNESGQLGLGDTRPRGPRSSQMGDALAFVPLPADADIIAVDARLQTSCALARDGRLWCWGDNSAGQLGQGDTRARGTQPTEINALPPIDLPGKVTTFALGGWHVCAVLEDASVRCWGEGNSGETGNGETGRRGDQPGELGASLPPVDLGSGRRAAAVAAGETHSCVLLQGGAIKCFGEGRYGVLGLADTRGRGTTPDEMGDALPVVSLGAFAATELVSGSLHACARAPSQQIVCWGANRLGQLGIGHHSGPGGKPGQSTTAPTGGDARPKVDLGNDGTPKSMHGGGPRTCVVLERGRDEDGALDNIVKCWGGGQTQPMGDALPGLDFGERVPLAIAPGDLHSCALVVERAETIGDEPPALGQPLCWGPDVPSVGVSNGTGVPRRDRQDGLAPGLPVVDLGTDVGVVAP